MADTIDIRITAKDESAPAFKTVKDASIAVKEAQLENVQASIRSKEVSDALKISSAALANTLKQEAAKAVDELRYAQIQNTQASVRSKEITDALKIDNAEFSRSIQLAKLALQEQKTAASIAASANKQLETDTKSASTGTIDLKQAADSLITPLKNVMSGVGNLANALRDIVTAAIRPFISAFSAIEGAGKSGFSALLSGITSLPNPISIVSGALGGIIDGLGKIGLAANGIKSIADSITGMGKALLSGNANLEMTTISFKTLLGSAGAAQDMIASLTTFAASTPFELTGLESSTQNLLAFGFGAKDVIPLMTSMGDAISALGGTQANLDSLVHVMGQMRQEAHINAGDIMQMTNLGIPALQMLADHYHVTTGAMQEMVSKGLVPGSDAIQIFQEGMEQRYGGMMAAQSATFSGMISNLQDWATATTVTLTKPFFEPAKAGLKDLLDFTSSPAGQQAVQTLAGYIQSGVNTIAKLFTDAKVPVTVFLGVFQGKEADGIKGFDSVAGSMAEKLGILAKKAWEVYQAFSPLTTVFDVLKGFATGGLEGGLLAIEQRVTGMGKAFGVDLGPAMQWFNTFVLQTAMPTLKEWGGWIQGTLIPTVVSLGKTFISDILPKITGFISFIAANAMPVIKSMGEWFELHIIPLVKALAATFEKDILPALGRFGTFLAEKVFPALGDFLDWFSAKIIPVLGQLVRVFLDTVIPVLFQWWQIIASVLRPIIEWLADFISTTLIPAFTNIGKFLTEKVLPVINDLVNNFEHNVMPVLQNVAGFIGGVFSAAVGVISTAFQFWRTIIFEEFIPALGAVWSFISTYILPIFTTLGNIIGTVVGGAIGGLMWGINNIILPGFNLMTTVIGHVIDFIKTGIRTVANFFVDVINTPLNAINGILDGLRNIEILSMKPFDWLPRLPTLGYLSFAQGTPPGGAPGGLSLVGDNPSGLELLRLPSGDQYLTNGPAFLNLPRGSEATPLNSGLGTTTITINQIVQGQPDHITLLELHRQTLAAIEEALSNLGQGTANVRAFRG